MQLVYTDVCGSIDPVSLGGNKYFITFIDDFSRKLWVYILKENYAAFTTFKLFKALIEAKTDHKLITLRSDRCGEYTLNLLQAYYREQRINRQFTTVYTHSKITMQKERTDQSST